MWLYVDPGIGALVLQALIAGAAGVWLFFRKGLRRVFFWKTSSEEKTKVESPER